MRYRYAVSFEHDTKPVETARGEIDRDDAESAFKSAVHLAFKATPRSSSYRFYVVCVERIEHADLAVA